MVTVPLLDSISADQAGIRLDRYLRQTFPNLALAIIQRSIRRRMVRVNDRRITDGAHRLKADDKLFVPQFFSQSGAAKSTAADTQLVAHQDIQAKIAAMLIAVRSDFFVLNKPSGLAVQGGAGVRWHLDRLLPQLALMHDDAPDSLRLVHRLDKDTSGVLLVARGRQAAQRLTKLFTQRKIGKYYWAITDGVLSSTRGYFNASIAPRPQSMTADGHSRTDYNRENHKMYACADSTPCKDAKPALTHYYQWAQSTCQSHQDDSVSNTGRGMILLHPITGRKHQLRVHLSAAGTPIVGDRLYGVPYRQMQGHQTIPLCLHAWCISVPYDGCFDDRASSFSPVDVRQSADKQNTDAPAETFYAPLPLAWQQLTEQYDLPLPTPAVMTEFSVTNTK